MYNTIQINQRLQKLISFLKRISNYIFALRQNITKKTNNQ